MKTLKTILIAAAAAVIPAVAASAYTITGGEVKAGAVSDTLIYQGRLEKSGSPVSDTATSATSFNFSIHNGPTGKAGSGSVCACVGAECTGTADNPTTPMGKLAEAAKLPNSCLWYSETISTHVVSGIFSVSVKVPWQVFSFPGEKYMEVKVGGVTLAPRNKIGAVPYALVAKKLEDNASIKVSSMSLVQGGNIYLRDGCVVFNNNGVESRLCSETTATQIGGAQGVDVSFDAGTSIFFKNAGQPSMTITPQRKVGIGTNSPDRMLTVNGDMSIGGAIYGKNNGPLVIGSSLTVNNGIINDGAITIADDSLSLNALRNGVESDTMFLANNGKVGIGTSSPEYPLHVVGTIYSPAGKGIKTGSISIGADSNGKTIQGESADLYIQRSGTKKVAIGTSETNLTSKLVVEGGVRTDSMTVTGPSIFNGNVEIKGNKFVVNNGVNTAVHLSTTTIYGKLIVHGNIGLDDGDPAYVNNPNTFVSKNTFNADVSVSSNVYVYQRMGVGVNNENLSFGESDRYLQVGDGAQEHGADVYLLGGSAANSSVRFYHGGNESSRIATDGANNLKFVVGGSTVATLASDMYLVNQDFKVAENAQSASPAIFVHGSSVAINTADFNSDSALTVNGQVAVDTIIFNDGTSISSKNDAGNPSGLRSNDAVVIDAANKINFINGGQTSMVIKDGKVGIGNVGDTIKAGLHVAGNVLVGNSNIDFGAETGSLAVSGSVYSEQDIKTGGDIYLGNNKIISSDGKVSNLAWNGSTIGVNYGGTGRTNLGNGILKGNSDGTAILSEAVKLDSEVENILPIDNGGTGHASFAGMEGPLRYDGGTSFSTGTINLAIETSGLLPLAHGGTNQDLSGKPGILRNYGTFIGTDTVKLNSSGDVKNTLGLANGGTGRNHYDDNGILYFDGELKQIILSQGDLLLGGTNGAPVKGRIEGTNISVDIGTAKVIRIGIPQSVAKNASPEFAGLKITGPEWTGWTSDHDHILTVSSAGVVSHSATIDLSNVSGILPVEKGGTGSNKTAFGTGGPVRAEKDGEGVIHLQTGKINISTETTGVLTPEYGGLGYSSYAKGEFVVAEGNGTFSKMKLSDGQIFIGNSNNLPSAASITSSSGRINVASTGGSIDLNLPQAIDTNADVSFKNLTLNDESLAGGFLITDAGGAVSKQEKINLAADVTGMLPLDKGGTNRNLSGQNGIMRNYGSFIGTDTVKLNSADVSEILPIAHGGTGRDSFPAGILRYEEGSPMLSTGAVVLDGGEVTGVLPMANGGTGNSNIGTGVVHSNGVMLAASAVQLSTETSGILSVSQGGTGKSSFTANSVIYADTSDSLDSITLGKGYVLAGGNGGVPVSASITGDSATGVIVDTDTAGSVKVKLVQDIHSGASPEFAGLKLNGLASAGFLKLDNGKTVYSAPTLSMSDFTGILPVSNGGTGRDSAYFAANEGPLYSNADGYVSVGKIKMDTDVTNVLGIENGGTGRSSFDDYSVIYAGTDSFKGIVLGAGQVLIGVADGIPVAAAINGVANQTTVNSVSGSITIGAAQDIGVVSTPTFAGLTLTGFDGVLKAADGNVSAGKIILNDDVEGTLPVANGGTGQNLSGKNGLLFSYDTIIGTGTLNLSSDDYIDGILGIENGGTNASTYTLTSGNIIKFNGTSFEAGGLDIESDYVTGVLPLNRGGTGISTDTVVSNSIIVTDDSKFVPLSLAADELLMGSEDGKPAAGKIVGYNGLSVSTDTVAGFPVRRIGLPQHLGTGDSPSFASITITGLSYSGDKPHFIKVDGSGNVSAVELSTSDIKGVFPVSSGGTGSSSFESNAIVVSTIPLGGTPSLTGFNLEEGKILASDGTNLMGLTVVGDASYGTVVTRSGDNLLFSLSQNLGPDGTPSFNGLTLSGLTANRLLATNSSGTITAVDVLPVSLGGTGNGSFTGNSVIVNNGGVFSEVHLGEGEFLMGNAMGVPSKYKFKTGSNNGIIVSTDAYGNVMIDAEQNLSISASVSFNDLSVGTKLSAQNATISDKIAASNASIEAETIRTSNTTVINTLVLGENNKDEISVSACNGSNIGAIKYCSNCSTLLVICDGESWKNANGVEEE